MKLNFWHIEGMRPDQRPEALRIGAVESRFKRLFQLPEQAARVSCREIIGAGTPSTSNEAKRWQVQMEQLVPDRLDWLAMQMKLLKK